MEEQSDWEGELPPLSFELITKFLAHVHSFTTVGLEARANAYSFLGDEAIKYLALLPQSNKVSTVEDRPSDVTEWDAVE